MTDQSTATTTTNNNNNNKSNSSSNSKGVTDETTDAAKPVVLATSGSPHTLIPTEMATSRSRLPHASDSTVTTPITTPETTPASASAPSPAPASVCSTASTASVGAPISGSKPFKFNLKAKPFVFNSAPLPARLNETATVSTATADEPKSTPTTLSGAFTPSTTSTFSASNSPPSMVDSKEPLLVLQHQQTNDVASSAVVIPTAAPSPYVDVILSQQQDVNMAQNGGAPGSHQPNGKTVFLNGHGAKGFGMPLPGSMGAMMIQMLGGGRTKTIQTSMKGSRRKNNKQNAAIAGRDDLSYQQDLHMANEQVVAARYDREFMLQFKERNMELLANLPNLPVIVTPESSPVKPNYHDKFGVSSSSRGSSGSGSGSGSKSPNQTNDDSSSGALLPASDDVRRTNASSTPSSPPSPDITTPAKGAKKASKRKSRRKDKSAAENELMAETPARPRDANNILAVSNNGNSGSKHGHGHGHGHGYAPNHASNHNSHNHGYSHGHGHRSAAGGRKQLDLPSEPVDPSTLSPLHKADIKWIMKAAANERDTAELVLRSILNKLAPEKFDKLVTQTLQIAVTNPDTLESIVELIFDKAVSEASFAQMYAEFCARVSPQMPEFNREDSEHAVSFRTLLLTKCYNTLVDEVVPLADSELAAMTVDEREEREHRIKTQHIGNIVLIGELFKKKLVAPNIMHIFMNLALDDVNNPEPNDIEALIVLLNTVGDLIDVPKVKANMDGYFALLKQLATDARKLPSRLRFMLKDLIELRSNKWVARREKIVDPKVLSEVMDKEKEGAAAGAAGDLTTPKRGQHPPLRRHHSSNSGKAAAAAATRTTPGSSPPAAFTSVKAKRSSSITTPATPATGATSAPKVSQDVRRRLRAGVPSASPASTATQQPVFSSCSSSPNPAHVPSLFRSHSAPVPPPISPAIGPEFEVGGLVTPIKSNGSKRAYNAKISAGASSSSAFTSASSYTLTSSPDLAPSPLVVHLPPNSSVFSTSPSPSPMSSPDSSPIPDRTPSSSPTDSAFSTSSQESTSGGGISVGLRPFATKQSLSNITIPINMNVAGLIGVPPSPSPPMPSLSDDQLQRKTDLLWKEYFNCGDVAECCLCVMELNASPYHPRVIYHGITAVLDMNDKARGLLSRALTALHGKGIITEEQLMEGLSLVCEVLLDVAVDVPHAPRHVAVVLGRLIADTVLPLSALPEVLQTMGLSSSLPANMALDALAAIKEHKDATWLTMLYSSSSPPLPLLQLMKPSERNADAFAKLMTQKELAFLL